MTTPAPAPAASDGKTLGIVGLIFAFVFWPLGLILSGVARGQSKKAGVSNAPATVGLVLSIIALVGTVIWIIFFAIAAASGNLTVTTS